MTRQYKNIVTDLNCINVLSEGKLNFTLITTLEEFIESGRKFSFTCILNHVNSFTIAAFKNKINNYRNGKVTHLCDDCSKLSEKQKNLEENKQEIIDKTRHTPISIGSDNKIKYKCGNCGSIRDNTLSSLLKKTNGYCGKCYREQYKNDKEDVEKRIDIHGQKLVTYNNCHNIDVLCTCGEQYNTSLSDIERGRKCIKCKWERAAETNMEVYGADNPFGSDIIKDKIKSINNERYGVDYPQQNPEIRAKSRATCMAKFNVPFSFCQPHVYEAIRKKHLENHGVEYPLQSKKIQDKIDLVFMEKYGVRRPFLSEEYSNNLKKIMLQKYGCEFYIQSEKCKSEMLEKYGSEFYIQSNHFKEFMIKTYGDSSPMRVPELFHKAMKNCFAKKKYVLKNTKREIYVMGFENIAIDYLLNNKNIFLKRDLIEDEIIVGEEVPNFAYLDDTNKNHRYYPDIHIKNEKLIYEVKSTYTFNYHPRLNYLKFKSVANAGYTIKVLMYDAKKKLKDIWTFSGDSEKSHLATKNNIVVKFDEELKEEWCGKILNSELIEEIQDDYNLDVLVNELEILSE